MRKTTRTLTLVLFVFLFVSTLGADEEASPFDGRWRASYTTSPDAGYDMEFSGDRFHAVSGEQWYKGQLVIDDEAEPARIDFVIEECECGFAEKSSEGIFRWDGESIEVRAPTPGDPRPTEFDAKSGETMRLIREGE